MWRRVNGISAQSGRIARGTLCFVPKSLWMNRMVNKNHRNDLFGTQDEDGPWYKSRQGKVSGYHYACDDKARLDNRGQN